MGKLPIIKKNKIPALDDNNNAVAHSKALLRCQWTKNVQLSRRKTLNCFKCQWSEWINWSHKVLYHLQFISFLSFSVLCACFYFNKLDYLWAVFIEHRSSISDRKSNDTFTFTESNGSERIDKMYLCWNTKHVNNRQHHTSICHWYLTFSIVWWYRCIYFHVNKSLLWHSKS